MGFLDKLTKIVLVVEYNGKGYYGFQWQEGLPTIQDELEKAIYKLTAEHRRIIAACRTDTGVHAKGQVVSFRTNSELPPQTFIKGLNYYLPLDIAVTGAGRLSENFDVRKDAIKREYEYYILNRKSRSPLENDFSYRVAMELNIEDMNKACSLLIGTHDFASFATSWDRKETTVRHVYEAKVRKEEIW